MISRRLWLKRSLALASLAAISRESVFSSPAKKRKFSIGACDWSLGMSADPGAFQIAKEIGLDGIMVNLGSEKNNLHLRKPEVQAQYLEMSRHSGIRISSIAIGELNNVPYKSDPRTEEWVWDSVTVAKNLHVPVVLLAFFNKNDLRNDPAGQEGVIRRLKTVAPHAEKNGIILGLETYLDANGHKEIIDKVGSSAVKVYFDFRNTADAGYNPVQEFTRLGKDLICELHMKENGHMLGQGTLDWEAVAAEIYRSGFFGDGWMQIEWARPDTADLVESYKKNLDYLRTLFADKI